MRILLLAGEESGEIYARQIRGRLVGHEVRGYGDYGFRTQDLAVIGVEEVLRNIFFLLWVKRTMERAIDEWKPDVVCTVDYPGMNLKLAAYAKARGIRTVHVVCPQVWAWKAGRIPKIERTFDRLCCFFPFEPALFREGFATFVGHPLVDAFRWEEERGKSEEGRGKREEGRGKRDGERLTLALLPGSRLGEIEKHLPVMLKVLESLVSKESGNGGGTGDSCGAFEVVIPAANERALAAINRIVSSRFSSLPLLPSSLFPPPSSLLSLPFPPKVQLGGARELLRRADCAVVASGTATLEAALANCPTVLVYKAAPIFAFIARRVIRGIRFLGLANIIWDKSLAAKGVTAPLADAPMPELLQENFTVENLKALLGPLVSDETVREKAKKRLSEAVDILRSDGDAIGRIADEILVAG